MTAQNTMLRAHASGLGSCPDISFYLETLQKILNLPAHIRPQLLIIEIPKKIPRLLYIRPMRSGLTL